MEERPSMRLCRSCREAFWRVPRGWIEQLILDPFLCIRCFLESGPKVPDWQRSRLERFV